MSDVKDRAKEKEESRRKDAEMLANGEITPDELWEKNSRFVFPNAKILFDEAKALS